MLKKYITLICLIHANSTRLSHECASIIILAVKLSDSGSIVNPKLTLLNNLIYAMLLPSFYAQ